MTRNVRLWLVVVIGLLPVVSGCTPKALTGEPVDLYAVQGGLRQRAAPHLEPAGPAVGPEAPYVPVMRPPHVQRVWTPAYVNDAGDLVSGHWVYLMLQPSRWFLEDGVETGSAARPPHHVLRIGPQQLGGGSEGAATTDRRQPRR